MTAPADLNGRHLGKTITVTSPEGWEATGVLRHVEHTTHMITVDTLLDQDAVTVPGYESTALRLGVIDLVATEAETVKVHPAPPAPGTDPMAAMLAELYDVDPANVTNIEMPRIGNARVVRWTERMVTNGIVTWATRASGSAGRFEFGGDTGLTCDEAYTAAQEEAQAAARQAITPGVVKA